MADILKLTVQHQYYKAIESGKKTIEGRTAKEKYKSLAVGEEVVFTSATTGESCQRAIKGVRRFPTFRSMLQCYGVSAILTDTPILSIEDACEVYYSFGDYKQEEKAFGVIALLL